MKKFVIVLIFILLVVVSGGVYQIHQYRQVEDGLESQGVEVTDIGIDWDGLTPTGLEIDLNANVKNNAEHGLEIEKFSYAIYLGESEIGRDNISDIYLYPETTTSIPISVKITAEDAAVTAVEYLTDGTEVRVLGSAEIPFEIWGVGVTSIIVDFNESTYYSLDV